MKKSQKYGKFGRKEDGDQNVHHLLYPRREWSAECRNNPNGLKPLKGPRHKRKNRKRPKPSEYRPRYDLRTHPYLRVSIPVNALHSTIHRVIDKIPVPSCEACEAALEVIESGLKHHRLDLLDDPPEKRLMLLISLWDEMAPKTARALKDQLELFSAYRDDNLFNAEHYVATARAARHKRSKAPS